MQYEYAVIDQTGQIMGWPARTFGDQAVAETLKEHLEARLTAMQDAAVRARESLGSGEGDVAARAMWREMIDAAAEHEQTRYTVMRRQVGTWEETA